MFEGCGRRTPREPPTSTRLRFTGFQLAGFQYWGCTSNKQKLLTSAWLLGAALLHCCASARCAIVSTRAALHKPYGPGVRITIMPPLIASLLLHEDATQLKKHHRLQSTPQHPLDMFQGVGKLKEGKKEKYNATFAARAALCRMFPSIHDIVSAISCHLRPSLLLFPNIT
ncbi:hypothetical protein TcWFU_007686 [Taenia crassiceps]|uniref:Uncharacterized protein n=1 Tax=Taenia crassiceps TaxID=6207 RepID=A0ABR4Q9Q7_9CEST